MLLPSNARLLALLDTLAGALSADDVEVLFRRIGAEVGEQEALDLRVTIGRALRSYVEQRKPSREDAGALSDDEHAEAARDAASDARDALAEIGAALDAGELALAARHAAGLEQHAARLRSHAEAGGRNRWKP